MFRPFPLDRTAADPDRSGGQETPLPVDEHYLRGCVFIVGNRYEDATDEWVRAPIGTGLFFVVPNEFRNGQERKITRDGGACSQRPEGHR